MIDLHTHSTMSDGSFTPQEVIKAAHKQGIHTVALTDHDTIAGLDIAETTAKAIGIDFLNGIECSVANGQARMFHILGIGFDRKNHDFIDKYKKMQKNRQDYLPFVLNEMKTQGIDVSLKDLEPYMNSEWMDRQTLARWIVGSGIQPDTRFAWTKVLDHVNYDRRELLLPEEAFELIHSGGGKSYLAHYTLNIGLARYTPDEIKKALMELKKAGLDGVECYYPSFTQDEHRFIKSLADELNFEISGGSDFHGKNRPHIQIGIGEGDFYVPDNLIMFDDDYKKVANE